MDHLPGQTWFSCSKRASLSWRRKIENLSVLSFAGVADPQFQWAREMQSKNNARSFVCATRLPSHHQGHTWQRKWWVQESSVQNTWSLSWENRDLQIRKRNELSSPMVFGATMQGVSASLFVASLQSKVVWRTPWGSIPCHWRFRFSVLLTERTRSHWTWWARSGSSLTRTRISSSRSTTSTKMVRRLPPELTVKSAAKTTKEFWFWNWVKVPAHGPGQRPPFHLGSCPVVTECYVTLKTGKRETIQSDRILVHACGGFEWLQRTHCVFRLDWPGVGGNHTQLPQRARGDCGRDDRRDGRGVDRLPPDVPEIRATHKLSNGRWVRW